MMRFFLTLLFSIVLAKQALCENIKVEVMASFEPSSAVGLVITPEKMIQVTETTISKSDKTKYMIEFSVPHAVLSVDDILLSAIVFSSDGDIAFSPTKELSSRLPSELPHCPADKTINASAENQVELLQSLVSIRASRRHNAQERLTQALSGSFLEKIQKLERGFGITYAEPLSAERPPIELIDRLTRVLNAVRNFQQTRKSKP